MTLSIKSRKIVIRAPLGNTRGKFKQVTEPVRGDLHNKFEKILNYLLNSKPLKNTGQNKQTEWSWRLDRFMKFASCIVERPSYLKDSSKEIHDIIYPSAA